MKTPFQLYEYFTISIIQDKIENVSKNFSLQLKDFRLKKKALTKVDFKKVCSVKRIFNSNTVKFILFEPLTNPDVTVFFPNFPDGWFTLVLNYPALFKKNAFQVGFTVDKTRKYPAYFFHYFFSKNGQNMDRTVHAIKEDKWVFFEGGTPLAIEDISNYTKRKITDRINNEIIIDYLQKAGYDLTNEVFFTSRKNAILFSNSYATWSVVEPKKKLKNLR